MSIHEGLFIDWLKRDLHSLDNRKSVNSQKLHDIVHATVLAVLNHYKYHDVEYTTNRYKTMDGCWTYEDVRYFMEEHRSILIKHFSTLMATPTREIIRAYCGQHTDLDSFIDGFIRWTERINKYHPSIQPCNRETAMLGFNLRPSKVIIWAAYNWRAENPEVTEMVRDMFPVTSSNSDVSSNLS